jgi:hypothetical protein
MDAAIKARQQVERRIIRQIVKDAIAAGYSVSVFDGEETTVRQSRTVSKIMAAVLTTDEDHLFIHQPGEARRWGWVRLVYGNDGWDVVNDYSTNLEALMGNANRLAEELQ